ncbi:MAG: glycosyltransferase [Eubacteriales bacterium]|nr:glycosyltransferase [Eubacteriales bacterium]
MKVLQISTVCGRGSVGRIAVDIYHTLEECKDQCLIAYGRGDAPEDVEAFRFGTDLQVGLHVLSTFFKGEHGFSSAGATRELIGRIRRWDPDVIQLHNIHGFVLQTELLFDYLKQAGKPVVWTLHDCWPYTGHCAFYDYNGCAGWKSGCAGCKEYRRTYPYALFRNHTEQNYRRKRAAFTGVPRLTIVTPSGWLAGQVGQSFLKDYPVRVIPNGIDREIFRPDAGTDLPADAEGTVSPASAGKDRAADADRSGGLAGQRQESLRERLGLADRFVVLGVANVWERRKGLDYFVRLAGRLPEGFRIVLIGLNAGQRRRLPDNILGLGRTGSARELAEYYAMADVFVNATLEDNFPTTNLEALSCGTPVITFDTGGSPESLTEECGRVVPKGDEDSLFEAVLREREDPRSREACLARAQQYEKRDRFREYVELYHSLCGQGE